MLSVNKVKAGTWIIIGLNLLMAISSIWIFNRMTPAIQKIIKENVMSIETCQKILVSININYSKQEPKGRLILETKTMIKDLIDNTNDNDKLALIQKVDQNIEKAFEGDEKANQIIVASINRLSFINREAMIFADQKAQRLGVAGAWTILFMAICIFAAGILFKRSLDVNISKPFEEINIVLNEFKNGETMRRCTGADLSQDIKSVYDNVNDLLDLIQQNKNNV